MLLDVELGVPHMKDARLSWDRRHKCFDSYATIDFTTQCRTPAVVHQFHQYSHPS
jgi:hypothetical protein